MSLRVIKPGLLTLVQDTGRWGYQRYGIVVGGAVDAFSARVANLLVGNPDDAAVVEMALMGPEFKAEADLMVALCGAGFELKVNDAAVPKDRPVAVAAGDLVVLVPARSGARAWLAVAGGIDVPVVLGSRSTYVRGRFGGLEGRPLVAGDRLQAGEPAGWVMPVWRQLRAGRAIHPPWSVRPETLGRVAGGTAVRAVQGPEWGLFSAESRRTFFGATYTVTKDVDRMGMRLNGPPLALTESREEISSAVNVGIIQVPTSGQPIVLLVGRQTVGGYPRIGAVASVDLGKLAQMKPGDTVQFEEITIARAHELLLARERDFERVKTGVARMMF